MKNLLYFFLFAASLLITIDVNASAHLGPDTEDLPAAKVARTTQPQNWTFPSNYKELKEQASSGDEAAQDHLLSLIYQGNVPDNLDNLFGTDTYWLTAWVNKSDVRAQVIQFDLDVGEYGPTFEHVKESLKPNISAGDLNAYVWMGIASHRALNKFKPISEEWVDPDAIASVAYAAVRNHAFAKLVLAEMRQIQIKKLIDEIVNLRREAANLGLAQAKLELGKYFESLANSGGLLDPEIIADSNIILAFQLYQNAADQGFPPAQTKVGESYDIKDRYTHWRVSNRERAIHWYSLAAAQGDSTAQFKLGRLLLMYKPNSEYVCDPNNAIPLLIKAARSENQKEARRVLKYFLTCSTKFPTSFDRMKASD